MASSAAVDDPSRSAGSASATTGEWGNAAAMVTGDDDDPTMAKPEELCAFDQAGCQPA